MTKSLWYFLLLMVAFTAAKAQPVSEQKEKLLTTLRLTQRDSARVIALMDLCSFHWNNGRNRDSVMYYAGKAFDLSKSIRFDSATGVSSTFMGRIYLRNKQVKKAKDLLAALPRNEQPAMLWTIGEHYLFRPGEQKANLDTAYQHFMQGLQIARAIDSRKWINEMLIALGKYHFSSGSITKGRDCFFEIIQYFQQKKDTAGEAHIWSEMGIYIPDTDSTLQLELFAHGTALRLYQALKDTAKEWGVREDMGAVNLFHANFDEARKHFLEVIKLRKAKGNNGIWKALIWLAWVSHATGDLNQALSYALAGNKNMDEMQISRHAIIADSIVIGQVYADDGQYEKSLGYFLPIVGRNETMDYFICRKIVESYLGLKQPEKALAFIFNFERKVPPQRPSDKETLAAVKGDCYFALKKPSLAEKYYREMISIDDEALRHKSTEIFAIIFPVMGSEAYYKIANFYTSQHDYKSAGFYIGKALQTKTFGGNQFYTSNLMRNIRWVQFKVDSALGNYVAAIRHYGEFTALNDSIYDAAKTRQLQHLQVQYETEKKESDIRSRDQQIHVLKQNDILRQTNLRQAKTTRNITIIATIVFFLLAALLYRQYIQKLKANKLITSKNGQLQHYLDEKEWLLKEIHHRVKNNLQIVMSLLNSQSAYIDNQPALTAINDSQHRVHAMSLIHQKLYNSENLSSIEMSFYIRELVSYLADSFDTGQRIIFEYDIETLEMDVSQAVPLGLILNEAITNAIKYAFPNGKAGVIAISLKTTAPHHYLLSIADNGIGMPLHVNNKKPGSLGMSLMAGLSEDLNGNFVIENDNGTILKISFEHDPVARRAEIVNASFVSNN